MLKIIFPLGSCRDRAQERRKRKEERKAMREQRDGGEGRTRREFTTTKKRERAREVQERKPQEKEQRRWRGLESVAISPTLLRQLLLRKKLIENAPQAPKKSAKKSNFAPQARNK